MRYIVVILLLCLLVVPVMAQQETSTFFEGNTDSTRAFSIWYSGTAANAKVMLSDDSLFLYKGAVGSEVGDTAIAIEDGAGILVISQTGLLTLGEIHDSVARSPNWHFRYEVGFPTDSAYGNGFLKEYLSTSTSGGASWTNCKHQPVSFSFRGDSCGIIGISVSGRKAPSFGRPYYGDQEDEHGAVNELGLAELEYRWHDAVSNTPMYFKVYQVRDTPGGTIRQQLFKIDVDSGTAVTPFDVNTIGLPFRADPGYRLVARTEIVLPVDTIFTLDTKVRSVIIGRTTFPE